MSTHTYQPLPSRTRGVLRPSLQLIATVLAFLALAAVSARAQAPSKTDAPTPKTAAKTAAVGTEATVGQLDGLTVKVRVEGPSTQRTPLQVACVFEYTEGDISTAPPALPAALNGMLHLDQALHGLITDLRKNGKFAGHALETLLIKPPKGSIPADQVLLVGLGDRKAFTPALMNRVGAVGMREALRLRVASYSHASDLKDAGIDSPTSEVAQAVITGARDALAVQRYISEKGDGAAPSVHALTLLAGPAFFADTTAAARALLAGQAAR
jgi:Cytosol aminopeptidase family, N-terminal domain